MSLITLFLVDVAVIGGAMLPADAFMAAAETEATQTEVEKIPLPP